MSPLAALVLCIATFAVGCLTGDAAADRRWRRRLVQAHRARRQTLRLFGRVYVERNALAAEVERLNAENAALDEENAGLHARATDDGLALAFARADLAVTQRRLAEAKGQAA